MRRLVLAALGLGLIAAAAPSRASAAGAVGYQYLTTYSGTYDFGERYRAQPGAPDGSSTVEHFQWLSYDYETIVVKPDHTYTRTLTSYVLARGTKHMVSVQGSGVPGGPFTSDETCGIYSDSTPAENDTGGGYIQPVLAKSNPLIEVGWMLPDYGSARRTGVPPFHAQGPRTYCPYNTSTWLGWSPSQPGAGVFASLPSNREMDRAYSGTATIHYAKIRNGPWTRRFDVTIKDTATRPGFNGPAVDSEAVKVDSQVKFERTYATTLPRAKPRERNKLVGLLISEGFYGLEAQAPASGPPIGGSGDPDTVVIPGFGPGEVSLDVSGTVVPSGRAHDAAGGAILLDAAQTRVRRGGAPVRLKLIPTAAGRRLLKGPHGVIRARYVLTFRPKGSRTTYRGDKAFTIPARA